MKGSKYLFIGGLVVAGIIVCELCKHFQNEKNTYEENISKTKDNFCSAEDTTPHTASTADVNEIKRSIADSVKERHYEAAKTIEYSLNTIFNENEAENIETENSEILEQTSNDLDDLLK